MESNQLPTLTQSLSIFPLLCNNLVYLICRHILLSIYRHHCDNQLAVKESCVTKTCERTWVEFCLCRKRHAHLKNTYETNKTLNKKSTQLPFSVPNYQKKKKCVVISPPRPIVKLRDDDINNIKSCQKLNAYFICKQ